MTLYAFVIFERNLILIIQYMIKALFFDIDGTLVSFNTHKIPASTIQAITKAKQQGIQVYISTGRPYSLINNLQEISHLIDGYITVNGAYCFIGKQLISCNPIPTEDVLTLIQLADEMNFACMVVGEKDLVMYNSNDKVDYIFRQLLNVQNMKEDNKVDFIHHQPVLQLTPVISEEEEKLITPKLPHCTSSRWYPDFADITALNTDKGRGFRAMLKHQGLKKEETIAFGDGGNDIPIIQEAGIGIAMGNANESLKHVADYITASVDEDGISKALDHWIFQSDK